MLNIKMLSIKEMQNMKAFLQEYSNNGNDSIDGLILELERSLQTVKNPTMSQEAVIRAKAKNKKRREKKKDSTGIKQEIQYYHNVCPSCGNGEVVLANREGFKYYVCGRIIDGRLQVGCGWSKPCEEV